MDTSVIDRATSAEVEPVATLEASLSTEPTPSKKLTFAQEAQIFCSTFFTIFLAELGDKTQVTTLLMSAESHAPWLVFAGAGTALVATSLIGVLLGQWLSKRVSPRTLEKSAAIVLLLIAATLIWDITQA